ncbi:Uncharacterized protein FKW44_011086 [Caligus rogercresseyi]|uniref:Uncharacterized protein n=1 Tax=Caligus rogercresseyi TaxID=217165 RepID=A0A7T8HHI1_CALRO|nr:Uncharacterized protein FKW44_011086 [Caligus rogercresseyi]
MYTRHQGTPGSPLSSSGFQCLSHRQLQPIIRQCHRIIFGKSSWSSFPRLTSLPASHWPHHCKIQSASPAGAPCESIVRRQCIISFDVRSRQIVQLNQI